MIVLAKKIKTSNKFYWSIKCMAKFEAKSIIPGKPLQEVILNSLFFSISQVWICPIQIWFLSITKIHKYKISVPYKVLGSINLIKVIITRFHKSRVPGYHFWKIGFKSHFNVFRKNWLSFEQEKKSRTLWNISKLNEIKSMEKWWIQ